MLTERIDAMYLRLSLEDDEVSERETEESVSIGTQRLCIVKYAEKKGEFGPLREFVDDGYSGTSMERPAMQRLLELIYLGRIRTVIVRDLSRFARNYLEAGHFLEYVFPAYNVRFISLEENFDSAEYGYDNPKALELIIRNLMNEMYSRDISKKIKSAVDIKKMNGEYVYGAVPYGYKKGVKKNTIVVDEEAAAVVKRIFDLAIHGMSITEIAHLLNDEKVLTPSQYLQNVRGRYKVHPYWTFESVKNILINRIYTGDTEPYKSHVVRVGSNRVKMIPEEERIVIPGTHEAIVSREEFYQARLVIKSNVKTKTNRKQPLLATYLVCGCCGKKLSKGRPTNKNWLCATARYTDEAECKNIRLNDEETIKKLTAAIKLQCKLASATLEASRVNQMEISKQHDSLVWDKRRLEREQVACEDALIALMDEFYDGKLSKEKFIEKKKGIKEKEEDIKRKLLVIEESLSLMKRRASEELDKEATAGKIEKHRELEVLDENLMKALVDSIVVYPDNRIYIKWNFEAG